MSTSLEVVPDYSKRIATALRLHSLAHASAAQMAIAAAQCGLELRAIRDQCCHGEWQEFFAEHFERHGLSIRTARKYMELAEGLKSKALKTESDSLLALLECPPSQLSDAETKRLTNVVSKMTDGATLSELYQEFGIVKRPQGYGAKGGARERAAGSAVDDAQVLLEGQRVLAQNLINLLTEGLTDRWWNSCDEAMRRKLHGLLEDVRAAVKETL